MEAKMKGKLLILSLLLGLASVAEGNDHAAGLVAPAAQLRLLQGGFTFVEGPVADAEGNLYFSDIDRNRIHRWSLSGELSTLISDSNGGNGLAFDGRGNLIFCEGLGKRISSLAPEGTRTELATTYNGNPFNSPNDVWVDTQDGIYFTDPNYSGRDNLSQDGEHVYYLSPDRQSLTRVVSDLGRPNGIIATPANDRLYVADTELDKVFMFEIRGPGELGPRQIFADTAADGITLDEQGNLYAAWDGEIRIFSPQGILLQSIRTPERPSNLAFGGKDHRTLFITARQGLYAIDMAVRGTPKAYR